MAFLVPVFTLLLTVFPAAARPVEPLEGLEALRRSISGISDLTAEVVQEKRLPFLNRRVRVTGTVRYLKPDLILLVTAPPYASRTLLRGGTVEQLEGGLHSRVVLPPGQRPGEWLERLSAPLTSVPEGIKVLADLTGKVYSVTIIPQGQDLVREAGFQFHEDGTLRRLTIVERSGARTLMTFSRVRCNVGLTVRDFRLK